MPASDLIGTWALLSTEWKRADGKHANPFGEGATGILIYDASGHMSAQIMRAGRPAPGAADRAGIDTAMASAVAGYVAYFGAFTIDDAEATVTHRLIGAAHPAWVGLEFVRRFEIAGDVLTLRDDLITADGVAVAAATSWQRIS
ncbi:MAG: lipocalin-like domain-containing protein [Dehalococcoidia bacterium]